MPLAAAFSRLASSLEGGAPSTPFASQTGLTFHGYGADGAAPAIGSALVSAQPFATLLFAGGAWVWVALLSAVVLVPLAWLALQPAGARSRTFAVALALRTLGIGLLLVCLLEPQWSAPRARRGANLFAVLADNSQGLQVADAGETKTRGEQLRTELMRGSADGWLGRLGDEYQVKPYAFDRDLRRVRDFAELDFTGDRTSLGAALKKVQERFAGQPLAGVLLFTDGNATDLPAGLPEFAGLPPIYPVIVGKPGGVRDVRLDRVEVRQTAFDDAPVSLRAMVSAQNLSAPPIEVSLRKLPSGDAAAATTNDDAPPAQTVRLRANEAGGEAAFTWKPEGSGLQFYEVAAGAGGGKTFDEVTTVNNRSIVMLDRGRAAYRILYVGGRPSWDYKFLNRALAEDPQLQAVGLIRVARREPKFEFKGRAGEASNPLFRGFGRDEEETRYDQPVLVRVNARDENELRGGFPKTAEELFAYEAVIIDDLEAAFFSHDQQTLLRRFAAERGGGLLVLGGADALESGGYLDTPLAQALPVYLDRKPAVAPQGDLAWKLTREGWIEPWTRVRAVEADERARLGAMPPFQVVNAFGSVKPGATVLATVEDSAGASFPALVAQPFGAGRVACIAIGDLWRWGLRGENEQADLARFWRQVSRWLVTDVPAQITLRAEPAGEGDGTVLRVTALDREFRPLDLATARLAIRRIDAKDTPAPGESFSKIALVAEPVVDVPGRFEATFSAREAGAYQAEVEVIDGSGQVMGRALAGWVNDPAATEFRSLEPNQPLLEELARRTGGKVLAWSELGAFAERLPRERAPIMEARAYPLWHQSGVFLAVLACFIAEWIWRRWRGLP